MNHVCVSVLLRDFWCTARGKLVFPLTTAHQISSPKNNVQAWEGHLSLHSQLNMTVTNPRNGFAKFTWDLMLKRNGRLNFPH